MSDRLCPNCAKGEHEPTATSIGHQFDYMDGSGRLWVCRCEVCQERLRDKYAAFDFWRVNPKLTKNDLDERARKQHVQDSLDKATKKGGDKG